jgi:hypothetical protein
MRLSFEADWRVSPHASCRPIAGGPPSFPLLLGGRPYQAQKRDADACPLVDHRRDGNWHSRVRAACLLAPLVNDPPPPRVRPLFRQGRQPLGRGPRARQWPARPLRFLVSPCLGGGRQRLEGGKLAGVNRGLRPSRRLRRSARTRGASPASFRDRQETGDEKLMSRSRNLLVSCGAQRKAERAQGETTMTNTEADVRATEA